MNTIVNKNDTKLLSNLINVTLTPELEQPLNIEKKDPLQLAKDLANKAQSCYFRFGGVLAYINHNKLYTHYGYESFDNFINKEIPNMQSRKGRYLMEVYTTFTSLGLSEKDVIDLGWSNASVIAPHATRSNIHELLDIAKSSTNLDLKEYIKAVYKQDSEDSIEEVYDRPKQIATMHTLKIRLYEDQYELLQQVFKHITTKYPDYQGNTSQLVAILATEYLMSATAEEGDELTPEDYIRWGESMFSKYNIKMENIKTGEIIDNQKLD